MLTKEDILNKLLENKPISIVRCGDGEGIMLNAMLNINTLRLASEAVLRRQLGYDPTVKQVEEIRNNLIEAYNYADIIGLPMHKQQTNAHWGRVAGILEENAQIATDQICDIDVAYQFLDNGSYDTLLQNRDVLNYISCRDLDKGFQNKWNIERVNKYTIAPESKFTSGYDGEVHYPTQLNKIPRWMDVMSQQAPGSLLFVGAGVIGKIYCNWWRDRGGVAMDVGAVMDAFAGKVTRGPDRGLDKEDIDSKYKL